MKKTKNLALIGNLVSAVLLVVMLVCLLLPFWNTGAEQVSIASYLGFPTENKAVTEYLTEKIGETYTINDLVLVPVILLVGSVVGAVLCLVYREAAWTSIITAVCGVAGVIGYLTQPALQLGGSWVLHLIVCILLVAAAVVTFLGWDRSRDADK